jgi:hypothetical protein
MRFNMGPSTTNVTSQVAQVVACVFALASAYSSAFGHGTPIHVEVSANKLVVSNGWTDTTGFAPMIFGEDDEDGEPFASPVLPQVGPVILWQLPGLDLSGMDDQSSLSIEVLLRPAKDVSPVDERLVWYWNPASELVSASPAAFHLLGSGMRFTTLTPIATDAPEPFLLADPIAGQQGFHNHGLISFALDNDSSPPAGVYGFFSRLISDVHAASDPFLIVFNHNIEPAQVPVAGMAINAAAMNVEPISGDYDGNGTVDVADYDLWRARFGNTVPPLTSPDGNGNGSVDAADYVVWRNAVGEPAVGALASAAVPEANLSAVCCTTVLSLASIGRNRRPKKN